jgi:predicted RNA-binding Zn ribbon-like protein
VVEFAFGGRLSLDLTWTLRFRAVWPTELLVEPDDLGAWIQAVGLPAPAAPTRADVANARRLREVIFRAATAAIDGRHIDEADREHLNRWAARPSPYTLLAADGTLHTAAPAGREVAACLSAIARDAVTLLAGAHDGRLRRCSGPQCSLLFCDDSRPGNRRWCTTARCGNKVNTKAYRARHRDAR